MNLVLPNYEEYAKANKQSVDHQKPVSSVYETEGESSNTVEHEPSFDTDDTNNEREAKSKTQETLNNNNPNKRKNNRQEDHSTHSMKKRRKTDVPHTTSEHSTEGEHQGENQHEYMNLSKEERESREKFKFANSDSDMNSGEVNKAAVDETTAAVERTIYTTTKLGETIRSVANKFSLHWRDIAEINLFKQKGTDKFQMPFSNSRLKRGTELNLPCLRLNITKVMSIIQNITESEINGTVLKETGDPMDPFGVSETEARKWQLPTDFWDVMMDPLFMEWIKSIRKEMQGFEENHVWLRTKQKNMVKGKRPIKTKEIYSRKYKHGKLSRHKYRHAARGDMLRAGKDYGNTYWSSVSSTSLKLFCALAVESGEEPEVLDVQTAYLEAEEPDDIYMYRASFADYIDKTDHELQALREKLLLMTPHELKQFKKEAKLQVESGDVEKCLRSVYGVPSAGNSWGRKLRKVLEEELGLKRSVIDNSLYYKRSTDKLSLDKEWLLVCTITDDIPFNGDKKSKVWFKEEMEKRFRITHEPHFTGLLGIELKWDPLELTLELTQTALINKISETFKKYIVGRHRKYTPLPENLDKTPPDEITDEEFEKVKDFPYASYVCSLGYIAEWSKGELLYARSYLSTYLRRWDTMRVEYALQSLCYLIGDKLYGTIFSKGRDVHGPMQLYAFADGSLMGEAERSSRAARLLKMSGAAISAKSNKTTTKHLSSTGVEGEALCDAALDIVGTRHLLEEIGIWYNTPVVIYEDNQPIIRVANNEASLGDAGRHMETRIFKIKELVENETVIMKYIETQRQVADLLTKSLGRVAFERLRDDMTGYLAFHHPGENIHVKSIAVLHFLYTGKME